MAKKNRGSKTLTSIIGQYYAQTKGDSARLTNVARSYGWDDDGSLRRRIEDLMSHYRRSNDIPVSEKFMQKKAAEMKRLLAEHCKLSGSDSVFDKNRLTTIEWSIKKLSTRYPQLAEQDLLAKKYFTAGNGNP